MNKRVREIFDIYNNKTKEIQERYPDASTGFAYHEQIIKEIVALGLKPDPLCPNAYENSHAAGSWSGNNGYCGHCYCPATYINPTWAVKKTKENTDYNHVLYNVKFHTNGDKLERIVESVNAPYNVSYSKEEVVVLLDKLISNGRLKKVEDRYYYNNLGY